MRGQIFKACIAFLTQSAVVWFNMWNMSINVTEIRISNWIYWRAFSKLQGCKLILIELEYHATNEISSAASWIQNQDVQQQSFSREIKVMNTIKKMMRLPRRTKIECYEWIYATTRVSCVPAGPIVWQMDDEIWHFRKCFPKWPCAVALAACRWLTIFTTTAAFWLVQRCTTINWHRIGLRLCSFNHM